MGRGGHRAHPDNCLWVLCCCGCLPFLGLVVGVIEVAPVLIIAEVGCLLNAILMLPHDVWLSYKAVYQTGTLGPNMKLLLMLLLPFALVMWPIAVAVAAAVGALLYGLLGPMVQIFDEDWYPLTNIKSACEAVGDFWEWNGRAVFEYLNDVGSRRSDAPFDINLLQLLMALVVASIAIVVDVSLLSIVACVHLIPFVCRLYYLFWSFYLDNGVNVWTCMLFPLFCAGNVLIPALGVLMVVGMVLYGAFGGLSAGVAVWGDNNVCDGFATMFDVVGTCEGVLVDFMGDGWPSLFRCFKDCECGCRCGLFTPLFTCEYWRRCCCRCCGRSRPARATSFGRGERPAPLSGTRFYGGTSGAGDVALAEVSLPTGVLPMPGEYHPATPVALDEVTLDAGPRGGAGGQPMDVGDGAGGGGVSVPFVSFLSEIGSDRDRIARVWHNFFDQCGKHGREMIDRGLLDRGEVAASQHFLFVGLPSLVTLRAAMRSLYRRSPGLVLADGTEFTEENRPRGFPASTLWEPMMLLKADVHDAMPNKAELDWLEQYLMRHGDESRVQSEVTLAPPRKARLLSVARRTFELATATTRLPTFSRLFLGVLDELAGYESATGGVHPPSGASYGGGGGGFAGAGAGAGAAPSAPSAPSAPPAAADWECPRCTFINDGAIRVCGMCDGSRP